MPDGWGSSGLFGSVPIVMSIFFVLFAVIFISVVVLFIRNAARVSGARTRQAAAPEVQAQATVVDKRVEALGPGNADDGALGSPNLVRVSMGDDSVYQRYLVTFQQAGGERFEAGVPASLYGLIVEGDSGTVTMKGNEVLAFNREVMR